MRELFDRVRNLYGYATAYNADPNLKHLQKLRDHNLAEFDRMIAQERAQAKIEALREAAERLRAGNLMMGPNYIDPSDAADWLEHRADQMEETMSKYPAHLYAGCPCFKCDQPLEELAVGGGKTIQVLRRMSLCPECGSKRCPGAMDHENHKETRNA